MEKLSSIDYAKLIQTAAYNYCNVVLGNTQINKILFYVYGVYLAEEGKELFDDDTPKAWVYGPVFPRVYKKIKIGEVPDFTEEMKKQFMSDNKSFSLICNVCRKMPKESALSLTSWSHKEGSPWDKTIYEREDGEIIKQNPWGSKITNEQIKEYFGKAENRIYGNC